MTDIPTCRLCGARHWSNEAHKFGAGPNPVTDTVTQSPDSVTTSVTTATRAPESVTVPVTPAKKRAKSVTVSVTPSLDEIVADLVRRVTVLESALPSRRSNADRQRAYRERKSKE